MRTRVKMQGVSFSSHSGRSTEAGEHLASQRAEVSLVSLRKSCLHIQLNLEELRDVYGDVSHTVLIHCAVEIHGEFALKTNSTI
ncbi:hypothetical protein KIL84_009309 [Mauremys mutica]|uniref:Uncharacterized protein n=1 Tax=Mauremys mutica TaxID=74926 RepID=A0A9D3XJJ7_9SAUR|nr:hypothetical protein KIL84_009309 [Mauremys mutica]